MNRLPTAFIVNPAAARDARFGCMVCQWRSSVGPDALTEGLEHAALHESETVAKMFRDCREVIVACGERGVDIDNIALLLSKIGEEGWNCIVMDQMEEQGVLVRVRGMG